LRDEVMGDASNGWISDFGGWESIVISIVRTEQNKFCEGLNIAQIAQQLGKHPVDAAMDLLLEEQGNVGILHFVIDEEDVKEVMRHPAVLIGSDATARARTGSLSRGKTHPRAYGTFARVLGKYVREEGVLSLEEAVAKMTGRSARRLSLQERGILAEGNYADIVVFDPDKIADTATFSNPHSLAVGIRYVLVNGRVVVEEGELVPGESPGRVLRHGVN
jgi:N-acyl-D-aspartate/D-glutamate deacylase